MPNATAGRVVICRVGSQRFTVPVADVREIVVTPPITRIPGAPTAIRGVVNVRGGLVTVVNAGALLGTGGDESGECLVVLDMYDGRVAIEVDDVEDLDTAGSVGLLPALDVEAQVRPLIRLEAAKA